jgi:hypothetical protein
MERDRTGSTYAATPLRAVFESARQFGLSDADVLQTLDEVLGTVGEDAPVSTYLDELSGALARCILVRERERSRRG